MILLCKALSTCLFTSYLPGLILPKVGKLTGAGLVGSLFGVLTWTFAPADPRSQVALILGFTLISIVISDVAERAFTEKDPSQIVIDEWAGVWVALAFHPRSTAVLVVGFVLFRVFDVFKLPGVRHSGRLPGGWGVVLDDVLAGVLANASLRLIRYVYPF